MGTFEVTSSTLNNQYSFKDENLVVNGAYVKDAQNNTLQSISGACYLITESGEPGDYVGNFNGYMRNGEIKYSVSEMSRKDSNLVWTAIGEIEPYVLGENQEENAGE